MRCLLILLVFMSIQSVYAGGWIQKSDFGGIARHRSTGLSIGNQVYMGLGHYNGGGINVLFDDWWEFDPATNAWTQKADYLGGPCYHAAAFTIDNIGYVGTGRTSPLGNTLVQDFYKYDPITNTWSYIPNFPGTGRRGAVAFVSNGQGYVGTGQTTTGNTATFYKYSPASNSWSLAPVFPGTARTSSVAFSIGNDGYVGTGNTTIGSTNDFWQFSGTTNMWSQKANVGPTNRQEAAGFAINDKGYIGTGDDFSSGNNFKDIWEYDSNSNTWTEIGNFQGTARRYLVAISHGNFAYAGLGTNGTNFKDFWLFDQSLSLIERNLQQLQLSVYPIPSKGHVNFKLAAEGESIFKEFNIHVFSKYGIEIYSGSIKPGVNSIDLSSISAGIYFFRTEFDGHTIQNGQLILI